MVLQEVDTNCMTPQQTMKKYEAALASQEWKNVEPLMHDDICVVFSTGTFKGKSEVKAAFERNFALIADEAYSISELFWAFQGGDSAICLYNFHWQGVINGQLRSGGGRGTSVLVKMADGWKIVVEHLGPPAS